MNVRAIAVFVTVFLMVWNTDMTMGHDSQLSLIAKFMSGEPAYHAPRSDVSFDISDHRIRVPVRINDSEDEYGFLLDTGAMTCIQEDLACSLALEKGDRIRTLRKEDTACLTSTRSIRLGDMEVRDFIIPRMDIGSVFDASFDYAGFIGADFLRFFNVTIDYDRRILSLADTSVSEERYGEWIPVPLTSSLPMWFPYVQATMNDSITVPVMIDTGSPFALVVPLSFEDRLCRHRDSECVRSKGVFNAWPSTDPPYNVYARLGSFRIGDHVTSFLPALLTDLPRMVSTPLMGKDFLDTYLVCVDFPHRYLHLKPYPDAYHETNILTAGIRVKKESSDSMLISGVWSGSPADTAGLSPGDHVLRFQGCTSGQLKQDTIDSIVSDPTVPYIDIHIGDRGRTRDIRLFKDMLFQDVHGK